MRLLIRYMQSRDSTQHAFEGSVVSIGRGTDQTIQIADVSLPLSHSSLSGSGRELILTATGGKSFTVNGQAAKKQSLSEGDVVDISGHQLKVLAGEDGNDFTVEVTLDSDQITELKDRFTTSLKQVKAPQRKFTWVLFVLLLSIGLVIPSVGLFVGMDKLRSSPLPDDKVWLTGELHDSHAFMGDDCTFCHTEAFEQTRDEDCLYCHLSVNHHFDTEKFGRDYRAGNSCGDCHKEHSTTDSITRADQGGCTVCHEDLKGSGFDTELRPATDFLNDHPSFKLTMQKYDGNGEWHNERIDLWDEDLAEESNLIFPHDIHLAEEGIKGIDGDVVMDCADCHEADKGGYKMKIVTMEEHCSDCHALTFDPNTPNRVVPHGSPPDLMRTLREYYAYEFLNKGEGIKASDAKSKPKANLELMETRTLRRPGRVKSRKSITELVLEPSIDKSASLSDQAQAYIEARVNEAASTLFEKQTCIICHEVTRVDDDVVPWHVKPVKLSDDWMPLSVFKHESHKNMQCEGCHDAEYSPDASDVLMPDLVSCRNCHGGEDSRGLLKSSCISCHDFHLNDQGPMGELVEINNPHIGDTKMETATLNLRNSDAVVAEKKVPAEKAEETQ